MNELVQNLQGTYSLGDAFQTGMSNGGELSYVLARKGCVFKALASVTGVDFTGNNTGTPDKYPILEIHGTQDTVNLYAGDQTNSQGWGAYSSVEDTFDYWCNNNMSNGIVTQADLPDLDTTDGSTVVTYKCTEGDDSKDVWLYKVVGGGHDWPGVGGGGNNDIDAGEEAIKFFDKFNTKTPFNMANMTRASHMRKTDVSPKQRRRKAFAEYKAKLDDTLVKLKC